MKLSHIPGHEPTTKQAFAWKTSTVVQLQKYLALYNSTHGVEVTLKEVTEQMLLDFMADDKVFQKALKSGKATSAPAPAAAAPESF